MPTKEDLFDSYFDNDFKPCVFTQKRLRNRNIHKTIRKCVIRNEFEYTFYFGKKDYIICNETWIHYQIIFSESEF